MGVGGSQPHPNQPRQDSMLDTQMETWLVISVADASIFFRRLSILSAEIFFYLTMELVLQNLHVLQNFSVS